MIPKKRVIKKISWNISFPILSAVIFMLIGMVFIGAAKFFEKSLNEVLATMFTYGGTGITTLSSLYLGKKIEQQSTAQSERHAWEVEFRDNYTKRLLCFYDAIHEPLAKVEYLDDCVKRGEVREARSLHHELLQLIADLRKQKPSSILMPKELDRDRIDQVINLIFQYCESQKRDTQKRKELVDALDNLVNDLKLYRAP